MVKAAPKFRRISGCSLPTHPYTVLTWLSVCFVFCNYYGIKIFNVDLDGNIIFHTLNLILQLSSALCTLICMIVDPAELGLRQLSNNHCLPTFEKTKHNHVIENFYCHICKINVSSSKTKHCKACNKCVDQFDHHCKWLNTCIGARNYGFFIGSVVSSAASFFISVGVSGLLCANYFIEIITGNCSFTLFRVPFKDVKTMATVFFWLLPRNWVVYWIIAVTLIELVALCFFVHLLFFHIFLNCEGLNTYEYTIKSRLSEKNRKSKNSCCKPSLCRKRTARVSPTPPQSVLPQGFFDNPATRGCGEMPDTPIVISISPPPTLSASPPHPTHSAFHYVFDRLRGRGCRRNKTVPVIDPENLTSEQSIDTTAYQPFTGESSKSMAIDITKSSEIQESRKDANGLSNLQKVN